MLRTVFRTDYGNEVSMKLLFSFSALIILFICVFINSLERHTQIVHHRLFYYKYLQKLFQTRQRSYEKF